MAAEFYKGESLLLRFATKVPAEGARPTITGFDIKVVIQGFLAQVTIKDDYTFEALFAPNITKLFQQKCDVVLQLIKDSNTTIGKVSQITAIDPINGKVIDAIESVDLTVIIDSNVFEFDVDMHNIFTYSDLTTEQKQDIISGITAQAEGLFVQLNSAIDNANDIIYILNQFHTQAEVQETTRQSAETSREGAEQTRQSNETSRQSAETSREEAEQTRQSNETNRQTAETNRGTAEQTRQTNETARVAAETARNVASNIYNVTLAVPLTAGQYYTSATARAVVPVGVRKKGLELVYETAAGVWFKERFIGSDVANWTIANNWESILAYNAIVAEINKASTLFSNLGSTAQHLSMRDFLVDIYISGTRNTSLTYAFSVVQRNYNGWWVIALYSATGSPGTIQQVARFETTSNPENGDKITIHTLNTLNNSGILAYVAVNWSKINNGNYTGLYEYNGYGLSSKCWDYNYSLIIANYINVYDYAKKNSSTLLLENTRVNDVSYYHPSGDSEYVGDSTYANSGVGMYLSPQLKKLLVRRIKAKMSYTGTGSVTVSVYTSKTSSAAPDGKTLVENIEYAAGTFNTSTSAFQTIVLSKDLVLQADDYLWVYVTPSTGNAAITKWNTPVVGRDKILFKSSGVWYFGSTAFNATPFVLLSSLRDDIDYSSSITALDNRIKTLENNPSYESIEISLPDTLYAIVGDKLQLFYRGMIKHPNPYIYNILISCSKGKQYPRYFEYLPVVGDIGTTTFKVEVKNNKGVVLGTKTCNLITKSVVQSPATAKKILCIGDSLTSAGTWPIEASRRLIGSGGTPAGLGLSNIAFVGRKTSNGVGWEGTGGWSWSNYATSGSAAYKFTLLWVVTAPAIGAVYTNNGIQYTVSEVNITNGSGYISATGIGAPTSSGTLTKVSGNGDSALSFSSSQADSGNPFWEADTNSLDFPQYVNTYMGGSCDAIYFLLSWNGQTAHKTDFASMIATAKTLIDHIHTNYPSCKIKIMGIQVPSLNGGMGANYGATGADYADTYGMVVTALNLNKAYQDWCNEAAYSSFMEFVNVSAQFDSENNMPESDAPVNTRSAKTEKIGTNGVHPATEGYYQIADAVFRNFIANFCQ